MASKEEVFAGAKDIINQLAVIIRTAAIHDPGNVAVTTAVDKFVALMNPLIASEGELTLELGGEFFYINETRIRYSLEYLPNFDFLIREFKKRGLGSIVFKSVMKGADMQTFLKAFIASIFSQSPFETLSEDMAGVHSMSVGKLRKVRDKAEGEFDIRREVKKSYFNAVSYTRGVINKIKSGEKIGIKKAKRVVEGMVDLILEEEQLLLGMTAIKDYDEYTYHHSVNVSILSVALGQRLGLSKKILTELGLVALFHDIGKIEIPNEILNKPTNFTDDEWVIMKRHPFWGVRALLKLRGFDATSMRSAIVAFEHHMNYDFSGYPKTRKRFELDFYSKIISLADQYDGMTSSRVYSRIPMSPDRALSLMMERAGKQLDPILFKFFINMIGVFPVGTLVMLDTKELGLVYQSEAMFLDRPKVLVILNGKGEKADSYIVDLTEKDSNGNFLRTIVKTMDPNKYKINLAEYLL
ncbi:MAG: HD-GYP domain-containing protein [Thermodesulfovibrionales bacterium]|nr:HD-GYP domain-containing protein [Thermodesulfovibrionales bacterium]MDP3110698.1 HD-GYP domain-containing protein [Thermodesulfovibrionales bacterium]